MIFPEQWPFELPKCCIYSDFKDQYSELYSPQKTCKCGCEEWLTQGQTYFLGTYNNIPMIKKHVHRCSQCNEIRLADLIKKEDKE